MKIKELQKTVNITWSPAQQQQILLAAGTAAQQFDSNASATLEVYSPSIGDASYDLELKASVPSEHKFQKLIWSPVGPHPSGLIVGGCESGHINVYSAAKLLANEESLLARQTKHTGVVSGLDFNPFLNNLLASCASESEIYIWDLNNPVSPLNPGAKTQPLEDVKNVAWNRQVQHILASVFSTRCVIWDLRKSQQIIKLSDTQSRVRWHAIEWHPEVATQVWLASEDDQAPVVQLWDLRYATAPTKTYQIHDRGVLGMSWCLQDTDLMVSCGKDNRIYCWNPNTNIPEGEILSEVATTASWYSDVQFCPRNPALIASASLEGAVSIYSLNGGTHHLVQTSEKIADSFPGMDQFAQAPLPQQATQVVYHDLTHAPKWMKRPCGVAFGFGGKLVSFNNTSKTVKVSQLTTEPGLVDRANELEQSLVDANYAEYCRQRADKSEDQHGRYIWYFIKANFELNPKEEMLNLLGYNKDDIDGKFAKFIKEGESNSQSDVDTLTTRISTLTHSDSSEVECDQSTNSSTDNSQSVENNKTIFDSSGIEQQHLNDFGAAPKHQFKIPSGDHNDSLITEAILTGNTEAAVELCLESQRIPEALIIASTAGIDTLTRTQNRYLQQQKNELSNVISALVSQDWLDFVNRCTVDSWKEALVAALKHSERKLVDICERLGDRLISESASNIELTRNAMLCYICAGSIDKLVSAWYQLKQLEQQNQNYKLNTSELQELAEVVMLLSKSLEQQGIAIDFVGRFAGFISEYSGLLASQGALTAALQYISTLSRANAESEDLNQLRERITQAVNVDIVQPVAAATAPLGYRRQQEQRGSFSTPANPLAYGQPHAQYGATTNGSWSQPAAAPPVHLAAAPFQAAQPPPQIYNPPQMKAEPVAHPPRPSSNASSQGGPPVSAATGSSLHSRSKYVLDPSVAAPTSSYGMAYNPVPAPAAVPFTSAVAPVAQPAHVPQAYNTNAFNTNPMSAPQYNQGPFGAPQGNYLPGVAPIETMPMAAAPAPLMQNIQRNPTPPPGWNDPPALKSARVPKPRPVADAAAGAPIMHPLYGVDPNQNQNSYMDPNQYQQNAPPAGNNAFYNPTANNNPQAFPAQQQLNFQPSAVPNQQQQQYWPGQQQQQSYGYTEQPAPIQEQRQPEPPKEKPPLPEEYIYLQTVLEELKNQCLSATNDPRTKRKFVDVVKRLENLYDCLRDDRLTPTTIQHLNQIVQCIQIADYANALEAHTRIAFGTDFAQCAGFMQGLKVLLQSASEMHLVLR